MTEIPISEIVDAYMAVEGVAAVRNQATAIVGENLTGAITRLVPHAAVKVASQSGIKVEITPEVLIFSILADKAALEAAVTDELLSMTGHDKSSAACSQLLSDVPTAGNRAQNYF